MTANHKQRNQDMTVMPETDLAFPKRLIVAIGGNAVHPAGMRGEASELRDVARKTGEALRPLLERDSEIIITHGNGPGVGMTLMRQTVARDVVAPMDLDICVAHTQGGIGFLLGQGMENALRAVGNSRHVVCVLTHVEIDPDDPGFANPTKPVGAFYSEDEAKEISAQMGWTMREDAGRGWRVVVPSPEPKHIVDISMIQTLTKQGYVVIAGGGGGVPVARSDDGTRTGLKAVIDKDLTAAHMGTVLGIKHLLILTAVPRIAIDFGKPTQRELDRVTLSELRRYRDEGQFPAGSMGPKVDAAIRFLENGGERVIIAHLMDAEAAILGRTGTHIVHDDA